MKGTHISGGPERLKFIPPCLPLSTRVPPPGEQWVHEPKLDGYRAQVVKDGDGVRIYSKGGTDWTRRLPAFVADLGKLKARSAILDAELCWVDSAGRPDFHKLMGEMRRSNPDPFRLVLYAFDLMRMDGEDLRRLPLSERRRRLVALLERSRLDRVVLVEQFDDGPELMHWCAKYDLEGVVSKRKASPYVSGVSRHWLKAKTENWREENKERFRIFEGPPKDREAKRRRR